MIQHRHHQQLHSHYYFNRHFYTTWYTMNYTIIIATDTTVSFYSEQYPWYIASSCNSYMIQLNYYFNRHHRVILLRTVCYSWIIISTDTTVSLLHYMVQQTPSYLHLYVDIHNHYNVMRYPSFCKILCMSCTSCHEIPIILQNTVYVMHIMSFNCYATQYFSTELLFQQTPPCHSPQNSIVQ